MTLLSALQGEVQAAELDFYWVPMADLHLNEYLPKHASRIHALSGFTGSAGHIIVSPEKAWIFVDGRYHIQVDQELDPEQFEVFKMGLEGVPGPLNFLCQRAEAKSGLRVGFDPFVVTLRQRNQWAESLTERGAVLVEITANLVDQVWGDKPQPLCSKIEALPIEVTGQAFQDKLERVREALRAKQCQATVTSRLDQIAWLFNARGQDIAYNPVFEAVLCLSMNSVWLFVSEAQGPAFEELSAAGVSVRSLDDWQGALEEWAVRQAGPVLVDPERVSSGIMQTLTRAKTSLSFLQSTDVIEDIKASKNEAERACMAAAGRAAGLAKFKALMWLEAQRQQGAEVTERAFRDQLISRYQELPGYRGLSFSVIAGAGANAASVHYSTPSASTVLRDQDLFLVDSGIHALGGTTDATRTVVYAEAASAEQRRIYTAVLKAHIACANQRFPAGTTGAQLDALTRAPLWQQGLGYFHGTGHGVGAFLNVHEGPMLIGLPARGHMSERALKEGNVVSIEPGFYRSDWGGVRIENLYLVESAGADELGRETLRFKTLTWIPLDRRLIDKEQLTKPERRWLDDYHKQVLDTLSAETSLSADEQRLLEAWCAPL